MMAVSGAAGTPAAPAASAAKARGAGAAAKAAPAARATPSKDAAPEVSAPAEPSDDRNFAADQDLVAQTRRVAALAKQQQQFNFFAMEHAELLRELNAIADMQTAQTKVDDDAVKDWIREIS